MSDTSPVSPATEACKRDQRGDILAYAAVGLVSLVIIFSFVMVMLGKTPNATMTTLVVQIVTGVFSFAAIVYGFQFGSSQGSQDKNATIANSAPVAVPPADPTKPASISITSKE